jgi:hypothetical protein
MCWSERVFFRTKIHLIKYFIEVTREVPPLVTRRVVPLKSYRGELDEKCQKEFNDNLVISFAIETLSLITTEKFCLTIFLYHSHSETEMNGKTPIRFNSYWEAKSFHLRQRSVSLSHRELNHSCSQISTWKKGHQQYNSRFSKTSV